MTGGGLTLAIDVGTGSVRAALVGRDGRIEAIEAREHDQIVPEFGWSEQRPDDWWAGVVAATRLVLGRVENAAARVEVIVACGQMHGTVLLGTDGRPTHPLAPLWNDKRTAHLVAAFEKAEDAGAIAARTGNPPTAAWPAFKLQWLAAAVPEAVERATAVLMPKDYVNFRLTGEVATDRTEASLSYLMDAATGAFAPDLARRFGIDPAKLPAVRAPGDILGAVTPAAAAETGLRAGTPVLVGAGDYPMSLLGAGAASPGLAADVTGTSSIITVIAESPLKGPEISNVGTVEGAWGAFMLLDSGGDAMRWARRAFHEKALSYDDIVRRAAEAPAGAEGLFFLPFLAGERLGRHRNARAQFFGLAARHGLPHLHRAVLEGVAFAMTRQIRIMEAVAGQPITRVVASGGGAKTELWLKIKAAAYGVPIVVPEEAECGVIGCAILGQTALGHRRSLADGVAALVRLSAEIAPDPASADRYRRMQPVFERIYLAAQPIFDDLDGLAS